MEDIRIMRKTSKKTVVVGLTTANRLFVPFNINRVALIISSNLTDSVAISTEVMTAITDGINIPVGTQSMHLDIKDDGIMVMGPLYGWASGSVNFAYTETVLDAE